MNSYYQDNYYHLTNDLVVFSSAVLVKYFKAKTFNDLYLKLEEYIEENKERLSKIKTPEKYLYPNVINDYSLVDSTNIKIVDDVDLTLIMMMKTFEYLYIPNREIKFNEDNLVSYLVFNKEDLDD